MFRLSVPLLVTGPPVRPVPLATLVTVPPVLGAVFVRVTVPPNATVPPPERPDPAVTVMELLASMAFVTPADGMLIMPLEVIGPPVNPAPVATLVTVPLPPLPPPKVWPGAKVIRPLLAIESPVSVGLLPFDPNSRFRDPEGVNESLPVDSAIQRKSCMIASEVELLNEEACKSSGFELKPCVAVAVPVPGNRAPPSVTAPVNAPVVAVTVVAASPPLKAAVVPVSAPVRVPPASRK